MQYPGGSWARSFPSGRPVAVAMGGKAVGQDGVGSARDEIRPAVRAAAWSLASGCLAGASARAVAGAVVELRHELDRAGPSAHRARWVKALAFFGRGRGQAIGPGRALVVC